MSLSFEQVLPDLRKGAVAVSAGKRYKIVKLTLKEQEQLAFAELANDGSDKVLSHVFLTAEQIVSNSWKIESHQVKRPLYESRDNSVLLASGVPTSESVKPSLSLQHFSDEKAD